MTDLVWTPITIRLGQIKPWDANPRMSTKREAERLIQSERELGQMQTFAVGPFDTDGTCDLYDGHQRQKAWFTVYGASREVTALQSNRPLREDERRKAAILLHTATGGWDWNVVSGWNTGELKEWGLIEQENINGWQDDITNVKELMKSESPATDAEVDTDRAAELLEKWGVKTGDLWQIGDHRLICGDCTDAATVARVMQTDRADLFITDPPYNIGFAAQRNKETYKDTDDNLQGDEYLSLISGAYYNAMEHAEKGIVTCGKQNLTLWANNFEIDEIGVWIAKNKMSGGKVSNLSLWEPVLFFGKFDRKARVNDLFEYSTKFQPEADDHPCPKILELWEEFIKCYSSEIVIDTFLGSGTSIVACQNLQRRCRAIEISAAYVSVALERMSAAFPDLPITRLDVTPK